MQESKNDQNYLIANSKNVEKLIYHNKNQIKSNWIESREKKMHAKHTKATHANPKVLILIQMG